MSRLSDLERGRAGAEPSEPAPLGHRGDDTRWVSGHGSGVAGSQSQPRQTPGIGFIMMLNCGRAARVISLYNVRAIIFYVNLSTYIYNFSCFFTFSTIPYTLNKGGWLGQAVVRQQQPKLLHSNNPHRIFPKRSTLEKLSYYSISGFGHIVVKNRILFHSDLSSASQWWT